MAGLAIFGGTFDPIHNAHLKVARAAADRCGLERVLLVPSSRPPHRPGGPYASFEDRFQMVSLACESLAAGGGRRFEASRLEEGPGISYSIDTIARVEQDFPLRPLYFLIGADAFAEIRTWHRSQEVIGAVRFIVVSRPGAEFQIPPGARVTRLEEIQLPVSSSEIRAHLAAGDRDIPDVPPLVLRYIRERGLYRESSLL